MSTVGRTTKSTQKADSLVGRVNWRENVVPLEMTTVVTTKIVAVGFPSAPPIVVATTPADVGNVGNVGAGLLRLQYPL